MENFLKRNHNLQHLSRNHHIIFFPLWIKNKVTAYFKIYFFVRGFFFFLHDYTRNEFQVDYVPLWIKDQVIT